MQRGVTQIAHTTVIDHGDARKKLPKRAKELGVDVIVMGRRGMTADKRSPVGSVSQYVVEHAPCSVIVIKEEKGQSAQEEAEDEPTEAKEEEEQKTSSG
jgi:predicted phosphodiesterase